MSRATARRRWVFLLLAGLVTAGTPAHAQMGRFTGRILEDRPTAAASLPDRLILECTWEPDDTEAQLFIIAIPPDEVLTPHVLDAEVAVLSGSETTRTLANPADWLNKQTDVRARMFTASPLGYFRHYRIFELKVSPTFEQLATRYAARRVRWEYPWKAPYKPREGFRDEAIARKDQGFGDLLPRLLANPDALPIYADPSPPAGDLPVNPNNLTFNRLSGETSSILRLDIDRKALFRLDLRSIPLEAKAQAPDLEHVQLYNLGQRIPLFLHEDPEGPSELIFYGVPSESKYTRVNQYWLTGNPGLTALRMTEVPVSDLWTTLTPEPSFPEELPIEADNDLIIHADNFLTISDFRWVWGEIPPVDNPASVPAFLAEAPPQAAFFTSTTFNLPAMADPEGNTSFDVHFYYSDYRLNDPTVVEIRINEAPPRSFTLQDPDQMTQTLSVPNNLLRETSNTLRIQFARGRTPRMDSVYFDRLVAKYRRRFEATGHGFTFAGDPATSPGVWRHYAVGGDLPDRPLVLDVADEAAPKVIETETDDEGVLHFGQKETRRARYRLLSLDEIATPSIESARYLEDAAAQDTPVDYLIIAHRSFLEELEPLVASLTNDNWRVRVVDVENVYASFSWGLLSPEAIKAYLAYTLRNWPGGGPSYALFVGDCTSDYRNDFRNDVKNLVPTYTYERGPRAEKWASEHWFTTLCGDDEFSDILLGRFSVITPEAAKTVIGKTVRYRTNAPIGPWRARMTYVADGGESFADHSERLRTQAKSPAIGAQRLYLDNFPWEDNFYLPPEIVEADQLQGHMSKVSRIMTTAILDMFNRGAALVSYRGHGSPNIWSDARIWFGGDSPNSDIRLMRNGERLPLIVNLTCNSGAIDYPDPPWNLCISEDFHRSAEGGAIALFVPTGPGIPTSHLKLSEEFHHVVFDEGVRAFGDIVLLAKYRYLLQKHPLDMIRMFLLLGDPSCPLQFPGRIVELESDAPVVSTLSGGRISVSGKSDLGGGQKGRIALLNPKEATFFSDTLTFDVDGSFQKEIPVVASDDPGTWTVHAYVWNDATRRDMAAFKSIRVDRPDLAIERFDITPTQNLEADRESTFTLIVANRSALAAPGVQVGVYRGEGEGRVPIEEWTLDFAPGEKHTLRVPWRTEAGFYRFAASFAGPLGVIGMPAPSSQRRTVDVAVREGRGDEPPAAVLPESLDFSFNRFGDRFMRQTKVAVANLDETPLENVVVLLNDDAGGSQTQRLGTLRPSESRLVNFQQQTNEPALPRNVSLELTSSAMGSTETRTIESSIAVDPSDYPNLTILADRIRFVDEGNREMFGDTTPTEGHTVFITVPIANTGAVAAGGPFGLEAFDGDPRKGGKRLRNGVDPTMRYTVDFLYPGEIVPVEIRWDPIKNAGDHAIFFRVDPEHRVTEFDETDNETSRPLRVLEKAKIDLAMVHIQVPTFDDIRGGFRVVDGTVLNEGETTVTQVIAEFFISLEQTPENKIGEVLIPAIGPGKRIDARLRWKVTPEQLKRIDALPSREKFSFLARQKGSTRRVTSVPDEGEAAEGDEGAAPEE